MIAETHLDGNPASTMRNTSVEPPPPKLEEIDQHAQNGWTFFTKFLFWNVVSAVGALVIVGLLTVWS